ncbi:hypothetical protein JRO89_XS07G0001500 [Xanthoceras sorbifolium]|uniref:DC1 domain-containing protein n=1 Tax=Xanthoceras sorbifolium TaxID=99658 RepID=A0ABQ8HRI4_9ROSI|nr:hypothetical protein JRO89_XS07G0001500 [Xanthoceras sorbifolium]
MMMNNRTLQKTRTFQYKRSTSMELQNPNPHRHQSSTKTTTFAPKPPRSTSFSGPKRSPEYPTSPQLIFGEERFHVSHPQHPLALIDVRDLFTCAGCKEYGSGKRFTCRQCDFQLHEFCALAPQSLKNHPLHCRHQLLLNTKPVKGGILKSRCDACGKTTKGYSFKCSACSFQMHPCCAMLSNEITYPSHPHTLKILPVMASSTNGDQPGFVCGECKKKRSGKVYRCTVCDYHLHAVCAKDMINGLLNNDIKEPGKPNKFGTAAKLASQVVIGFIGGLIEGFGEGVGEVLVQSMTRSGRSSRSIAKQN